MSSSDDFSDEYSTNGGGGRILPSRRAASLGQNKLKSSLKDEEMDDVAWSWAIERDDEAVAASRKRKSKDDDVSRKKRMSKGKSNDRDMKQDSGLGSSDEDIPKRPTFGVDSDLVDSDEDLSKDNSCRGRMIVGRDPESDSEIESGCEESDDDDDEDDEDDMPSVKRISRAERGNTSSLRAALKNDVDDGDESSAHPKTIISRIVSLQSPGGRKFSEQDLSTPGGTTANQLLAEAARQMAAGGFSGDDTPQLIKWHFERDPSSRIRWKAVEGAAPSPHSEEVQQVLQDRSELNTQIAYAKNKSERQVLERQAHIVNKKLEKLQRGGKWERASKKRQVKYGQSAQVVYTPPRDVSCEMVVEQTSYTDEGFRTSVICPSGAPNIHHCMEAMIEQGCEMNEYVTFVEASPQWLDMNEIELQESQSLFFHNAPGGYVLLQRLLRRSNQKGRAPGYPEGTVSCRNNVLTAGKTDPQISVGTGNGESRNTYGLHIALEFHFGGVGNKPMPAGRTITIDHINGDKHDWRPVNLRRANARQQGKNRGKFTAVASDEDYFSSDDESDSDVDSDLDSD